MKTKPVETVRHKYKVVIGTEPLRGTLVLSPAEVKRLQRTVSDIYLLRTLR